MEKPTYYDQEVIIKADNDVASYYTEMLDKNKKLEEYIRTGTVEGISLRLHNELEILFFLDKLGYDVNRIGTHYFKELIHLLIDTTTNVYSEKEIYSLKDLIAELKDPNSELYKDICTVLHIKPELYDFLVQDSINNKFERDEYVEEIIYGKNKIPSNYGINALKISAYLNGISKCKAERKTQSYVPQIKH